MRYSQTRLHMIKSCLYLFSKFNWYSCSCICFVYSILDIWRRCWRLGLIQGTLFLYFVVCGDIMFWQCLQLSIQLLNNVWYRLRAKKGPDPLGNFADISYLKENYKPHLLRDVCTLCYGALVSDSLLHMLLQQTRGKNQNESLSYRKKKLNHLIIQISHVVCRLAA